MKNRNNRLLIAIFSLVGVLFVVFVIRPRWGLYGDSLFMTSLVKALPAFFGVLAVTQLIGFASKKDVPMKYLLAGGFWVFMMGFLNFGNGEHGRWFSVDAFYIVGAILGIIEVLILEKFYFKKREVGTTS